MTSPDGARGRTSTGGSALHGRSLLKAATAPEASRLSLIGVKIDIALRPGIDAYAEAHGVSRSRAAGHFLAIAGDAVREREGVPGSRADELLEAVDGLRAAVDILGPPTFGNAAPPGASGRK